MNVCLKEGEVNWANTVHPDRKNIFVYINSSIVSLENISFSYNTRISEAALYCPLLPVSISQSALVVG
jgi:hypothetical protein